MKNKFYVSALASALAWSCVPVSAQQQQRQQPQRNVAARPVVAVSAQTVAQVANVPAAVASLPASDAVLTVDVRRLLNEALPRVLASNPAKLAQLNADIDNFKAKTGLDARSFDRVALGVNFTEPKAGVTKLEPVAVAHGTFNAAALIAAARIATNGKFQEQKYAGKSVYVLNVTQPIKLFGVFNLNNSELAVAALDGNTLAIGKTERVRAAVDAAAGRNRVNPEIAALAVRDPEAVVGVGGNLPASLTQNLDFLNGEVSRSIASIKQFYMSVGTTATGVNTLTALRTGDANAARTLSDTILGLKQLAPFAISQLPPERARLVQGLVEGTQIGVQGNEVQIKVNVAQSSLPALLQMF